MADPHFVWYEGRQVSTASELGKELMKHEKPANYRPEDHPYPRAMYKAARDEKGKIRVLADEPDGNAMSPDEFNRALGRVKMFNLKNYKQADSYEEHMKLRVQGWRDNPTEALAYFEAEEKNVGNLAAERAAKDIKMSDLAQKEAVEADAETEFHLPEIPEKRRGRPRKEQPAA